jgi:outer membrane protein TolC
MKKYLLIIINVVGLSGVYGQENNFSLKQCIDYALNSNTDLRNAQIDQQINENKTGEARSKILPHVDGEIDFTHNINIQKIILENGVIAAFNNPQMAPGEVIAFQLQLKNSLTGGLNASQVIFDKSLFSSLNSTGLYKNLAMQKAQKTREDIIELVSKAYYAVQVSDQQLAFLNSNLSRIDSVYKEATARQKAGIVRQIDLYRIEVSLNNMKEEKEKALKNVELNKAILAYQMNFDHPRQLVLTDDLNEDLFQTSEAGTVNYANRPDYAIMQTQQQIVAKNIDIAKGAYYPRLSAFATTGYNPAATHPGDLFQKARYYNYTFIGARLYVPVFSGLERNYKLKNAYLEDEKIRNSLQRMEKLVNLEIQQAEINYSRSLESIKIQKRNLELAKENLRTIKIENEKGVVNNIEVVNAETDLRAAQNNYFGTLYQAYVAKIDLDKASGKLSTR